MKLINKAALKTLIDNGYVKTGKMEGITISSRTKKSRGKKYYAKDDLAFIAWDILGEDVDDEDFQKWKQDKLRRQKRNNYRNKVNDKNG